ncbi:carbohydrate ABC transporter permease [Paenibacillus koleovorans]|uniref:carbohydrate ABC transporter permease n=1 Tax=Paenibacillus koleovorans TaxID=121608 RepID=UPI001FEAF28A|nr:sugar ABC transporter permease [Paenibacillus koleovorans]
MQIAVQKPIKKSGRLHTLKVKKMIWAYIFLVPQLLLFLFFTIYPIIMSYVYVFFDWYGLGPLEDFIGLDNFRTIIADERFWDAVKISFMYIGGVLVIVMPGSFLLAMLLNAKFMKGKAIYRTVFFIPVISTTAIIGVVMRLIFGYEGSLVNSILIKLGILNQAVNWFVNPSTALVILILIGAWIQFGLKMVYWLALLQSLPQDVFEAAKIDGSNAINTFRYITWPLLLPGAAVILLLSIIGGFNVFDLVVTLTGGGPFFATTTADLFIYNTVFKSGGLPRIGLGSAAGIIFGMMVFAVTLLVTFVGKMLSNRYSVKV